MTDDQYAQLQIRLQNWGRWAYTRGGGGGGIGHCGSVEHRYRAPKLGEGEVASHRIRLPVDPADAETIERAVIALRCISARCFLIDQYVKGYARTTLERKFRIHGNLYYAYRRNATEMVAAALRSLDPHLIRRGQPIWAGVARYSGSGV